MTGHIAHRSYSGYKADYAQMRALLSDSRRALPRPLNWSIAELDNWRFASFTRKLAENPRYFQDNAHLWFDSVGGLVGFVVSNDSDWFALQVRPDGRAHEDQILDWVVEEWAESKARVCTAAYVCDDYRTQRLQNRGMTCAGVTGVDHRYATDRYPSAGIPCGYHVESFADRHDPQATIELECAAFGRDKADLDREWFETKALAPGYLPEWQLFLVTDQGQYASFCVAWPDWPSSTAEIDPIGTHPAHRRRGLARALLQECFRRLNASGIREAQINGYGEGPRALYGSLEPVATYGMGTYELRR